MNDAKVWIVQNDSRKNFSDAERFGSLKDVFGEVPKEYDTKAMLAHCRRTLKEWNPGDHLLVVGDPTLVGVCMVVLSEHHPSIRVLRWDRVKYQYAPQEWDFDQQPEGNN